MNEMDGLFIPRPLATRLIFAAQQRPSEEICGLAGGVGQTIQSLYPAANIAADPGCSFLLDPRHQIDAQRRMRETGQKLLAVYHSHPSAPAEPSARDLAELGYPEAALLIISLDTKGVLEMRAWRHCTTGAIGIPLAVMASAREARGG